MTMRHDGVPDWAQTGKTVYIRDSMGYDPRMTKATVVRHTKTQTTVEYTVERIRHGETVPEGKKRRFKVDNWRQDLLFEVGTRDTWRSSPTLHSQEEGEKFVEQLKESERRRKIAQDAIMAARKVGQTAGRQNPSVEEMHAAVDAMQIAIREFQQEQAESKARMEKYLREREEREKQETIDLGTRQGRKF